MVAFSCQEEHEAKNKKVICESPDTGAKIKRKVDRASRHIILKYQKVSTTLRL